MRQWVHCSTDRIFAGAISPFGLIPKYLFFTEIEIVYSAERMPSYADEKATEQIETIIAKITWFPKKDLIGMCPGIILVVQDIQNC
jgi:hypothetical protein